MTTNNEAGKAIHELMWFLAHGDVRREVANYPVQIRWYGDSGCMRHQAKMADWGRDDER